MKQKCQREARTKLENTKPKPKPKSPDKQQHKNKTTKQWEVDWRTGIH